MKKSDAESEIRPDLFHRLDDSLCFVIGSSLDQRDLRPRVRERQKSGLESMLLIHFSADTGRLFALKGKNPQGYIDVFSPEVRFCSVV